MSERESTQFLRRMLCIGVLQICLVLILLGRMYYLQIIEGHYYHLLAEGNRVATRPLVPPRGHVYDRKGVPLAHNETNFRVVLLMEKKEEIAGTLELLSRLIPLTNEEKEEALKVVKRKKGLDSVILKDNLTWSEVSTIELHFKDLPGLSIEVGSKRAYPETSKGAHLLGYVASPSENEQENDPLLTIPGLKVGKVGIEKYFESRLRGVPGHSAFEVNAKRKVIRELHQTPSIAGEDIHLTLDSELQAFAQEALSVHPSGAVVVIDILNGDILALASTPSYDPNLFPQGIAHKDWDELRDNPYVPMTNKAISGKYAPGSTVKLFLALTALEHGLIDENTTIFCPGYVTVGNHKFHCMHQHGHMNLKNAMAQSCDVFFYELGKKVGIDLMSATFKDLGIGEGGLEDFPQSKKGLVPTKDWKLENKKQKWTVSDTILTSIGQGYLLSTPLELAVGMARLVSGKRVIPQIEKSKESSFENLKYERKNLEIIIDAAQSVTNLPSGTAYRNRIIEPGFEMGGKTGTSQVRRITMEQRKAGQTKTYHLPWKQREHGLFIGFAPVHQPRYAIAVVIEHVGGSGQAVQVARDILFKAQLLERNK